MKMSLRDELNEEQLKELDKLLQAEGDKVRTKYSKKVKELEDEAKAQASTRKDSDGTEDRIAKLEKMLAEYQAKEQADKLKTDTDALLEKYGADKDLAVLLTGETLEAREAQLKVLAKVMKLETKENLKNEPGHPNTKKQTVTKEQFEKMSYSERAKLYETNPEAYKALSQA